MTQEFDRDAVVTRPSAAAIWAAYAIYGALLGAAARRRAIPLPVRHTVARSTSVLLIAVGAAMFVAGARRLASPGQPTGTDAGTLVTDGIYRWSRNPQYVGCELVALGVAVAGRSGAALMLAFGAAGVGLLGRRRGARARTARRRRLPQLSR